MLKKCNLLLTTASLAGLFLGIQPVVAQIAEHSAGESSTIAAQQSLPIALLSPTAMVALISDYAFYPDSIVEQILLVAQTPDNITETAQQLADETDTDEPNLNQYPDLIQQLLQQPARTARLGLAARTQIDDVWAAVDEVRAGWQAQVAAAAALPAQSSADTSTISPVVVTPVAYSPAVYSGYVAGLWTAVALNELREEYHEYQTTTSGGAMVATTSNPPATSSTTITGPNGNSATMTGTSASGSATVGDTTYAAGAGTTSITGPQGNSATGTGVVVGTTSSSGTTSSGTIVGAGTVTGAAGSTINAAGTASGSMTDTANGSQFETSTAGMISNPATGNYAAGQRDTAGYTQQNADGSTTFARQSGIETQSSAGATTIDHQGSGTAGGPGNSSYEGSTTINSTHGNADIQSTAGNGQATTTITSDKGTKTYTAGDGTITNSPNSNDSGDTMSTPKTGNLQSGNIQASDHSSSRQSHAGSPPETATARSTNGNYQGTNQSNLANQFDFRRPTERSSVGRNSFARPTSRTNNVTNPVSALQNNMPNATARGRSSGSALNNRSLGNHSTGKRSGGSNVGSGRRR